jgi:hypothetical protein
MDSAAPFAQQYGAERATAAIRRWPMIPKST